MSFRILKNNIGQGQAVEYSLVFFLVMAVVAGMSTYVKRAVQARDRGARNFAWIEVNQVYHMYHDNSINMLAEYEPYYTNSRTVKDEATTLGRIDTAANAVSAGTVQTSVGSVIVSTTQSQTASPGHAD